MKKYMEQPQYVILYPKAKTRNRIKAAKFPDIQACVIFITLNTLLVPNCKHPGLKRRL